MVLFFQTRKPRRFHHEMIYSDERRERLEQLERRAKEELGMEEPSDMRQSQSDDTLQASRRFHFVAQHRRRARRGLFSAVSASGLVMIFVTLVILGLLLVL